MRFLENGREWKLPGLLYGDDLVLYGESEEDLRAMVGRLVDVCKRKGTKEFKYLRCVLDGSGTYRAECSKKVATERRVGP